MPTPPAILRSLEILLSQIYLSQTIERPKRELTCYNYKTCRFATLILLLQRAVYEYYVSLNRYFSTKYRSKVR